MEVKWRSVENRSVTESNTVLARNDNSIIENGIMYFSSNIDSTRVDC